MLGIATVSFNAHESERMTDKLVIIYIVLAVILRMQEGCL